MIENLFRALPTFKGKHRLARLLLGKRLVNKQDVVIQGIYGCNYSVPNTIENVGFELLINGVYEQDTIQFIVKELATNGVFLDIGANIGAIILPVSKLRKDIMAVGLEPAPFLYKYLESNVRSNQLKNVVLINKAVSNCSDQSIDFFSPEEKFGKGSFAPVFTDKAVKVETISLDDLFSQLNRQINFIKVDVEGFEGRIFEGGKSVLSNLNSPTILFEFVDWAEQNAGYPAGFAQDVLISFGYQLSVFKDGKLGAALDSPLRTGSSLIYACKLKHA